MYYFFDRETSTIRGGGDGTLFTCYGGRKNHSFYGVLVACSRLQDIGRALNCRAHQILFRVVCLADDERGGRVKEEVAAGERCVERPRHQEVGLEEIQLACIGEGDRAGLNQPATLRASSRHFPRLPDKGFPSHVHITAYNKHYGT